MTWDDFKEKLERAGLTVGLFAEMVGVSKGSIYTWSNRKIPYWVESWLDNYIRANEYQELIFELILALDALYKSLKKTISSIDKFVNDPQKFNDFLKTSNQALNTLEDLINELKDFATKKMEKIEKAEKLKKIYSHFENTIRLNRLLQEIGLNDNNLIKVANEIGIKLRSKSNKINSKDLQKLVDYFETHQEQSNTTYKVKKPTMDKIINECHEDLTKSVDRLPDLFTKIETLENELQQIKEELKKQKKE